MLGLAEYDSRSIFPKVSRSDLCMGLDRSEEERAPGQQARRQDYQLGHRRHDRAHPEGHRGCHGEGSRLASLASV
jgi:hypothetical protein